MTNLEKWKSEFAKAEDGNDLLRIKNLMEQEKLKWCRKQYTLMICTKRKCYECTVEWGNSEVEGEE